ncbi:MAG TPA: hypothetical protein VGN95_23795, partial [Pyrinomonadaceae bacterium]|nr:hypothetical protein [Pyrinomonadaceae bacterium]
IEAERDQKIAPIRTRFEQRCAPYISAANKKLEPLAQAMAGLEGEITELYLKEVADSNNTCFRHIDAATAVAEVVTRTERELDAKTFFESVPPSKRDSAFWSCLKTLIGQAEKFLGATRLNELVHAKTRHTVSITAKTPTNS